MGLQFKLGDRIGKGSFATVYKGRMNSDGSIVAVKVVHRAHLKRDKRLLDNFEAEMAILKQMKHPHIVLLQDVAQTESDFYLVMEYCSLGDLSYFIRKREQLCKSLPLVASLYERYPVSACGGLHETVIRHFLSQLAAALRFLREVNLVHRDIKPQNMLLMPPRDSADGTVLSGSASSGSGLWSLPTLKVADFGFARFLPSTSMAETLCGSPLYMAPEILNYEKYNAKADLWSVGAVVYEMVTTKPPFPAANHMDLIKRINEAKDRIQFPEGAELSEDLRDLISGLLKRSPAERMSFDEFFAHPALRVEADQRALDLSLLDENMYISEYVGGTDGGKLHNASPQSYSPTHPRSHSSSRSSSPVPKSLSPSPPFRTPVSRTAGIDDRTSPSNWSPSRSPTSPSRYGVNSNPFDSSQSLPDIATLTTDAATATVKSTPRSAPTSSADMGTSIDGYVLVEKRTVEVNALADDFTKKEIQQPVSARRRLSSIAYGTSPTNALAQALIKSSARLFGARVDSGTIQIPQTPMPGLANRVRTASGSESPEDKLTTTLDRLNRIGRVVAVFAELKQSQLHPDDEAQDPTFQDVVAQEALSLYLKALGILAKAMEIAAQWWGSNDGTNTPSGLKDIVQSIRDQFNDCIEKAEATRRCILNGRDTVSTPLASVERLLFERALELARSAATQEMSEDLTSCEMNYATALWMLRAITETEGDVSTEDNELVERLSARIQQRIVALRRVSGARLES